MSRLSQALVRTPVWLACLLAGLATALAHPPVGFLPGLLGYGLLMQLPQAAPSLKGAFWRGWLAGLAYFAVSCWWVFDAFQVDAATFGWMAPFAVALLAGGLALFWALAALLFRAGTGRGRAENLLTVVWFAGVFACLEWTRGHIMTGFPWNLPGETWKAGGMMSQSASIFGAYGLTWVTLAAAAAPVLIVVNPAGRSARAALAVSVLILAGMAGFGATYLKSAPDHPGRILTARIVQPGLGETPIPDEAARLVLLKSRLDRYIQMTAQPSALGAPPQLVFWPEGAVPESLNELLNPASRGPGYSAIMGVLTPGQTLVLGGYRFGGDLQNPLIYNSLAAVQRTGSGLDRTGLYDKYRLVPFGEYTPHFLEVLGLQHLVPVPGDFGIGPPPAPVDIGVATIQPLICYESLFPGFTRQGERQAGRRADLIVNISNDSWFGVTNGPLQNYNLSAYRAIEEGLTLVRSTPTGVSAVIDPHGRAYPHSQLGLRQQGVVDVAVNTVQFNTVFRRFGDAVFAGMLLLSLLALGAMRLRRPIDA